MRLLLLLLIFSPGYVYLQEYTCSKEICEDYKTKPGCPPLSQNCKAQNATHRGLFLPHLGPCNCCDYCLDILDEGETCAEGTPTSGIPNNICGDMLTCSGNVCKRMTTKCANEQNKYDNDKDTGELGHLQVRPDCDRNGQYAPSHCVPGEICYCVNENGERIFGNIPFTNIADKIMDCQCSRSHDKISNLLGHRLRPHEHLRCNSDGSYDKIQCIDDQCLCVDSTDGAPTFPNRDMVNETQINDKTLTCFDKEVHLEYSFRKECESKFIKKYGEISELKKNGFEIFGDVYPSCRLDGQYEIVQSNKTHKYCVHPNGEIIDNYIVDYDSNEMNCNCALANLLIVDIEKPKCCKNGNYNVVQCRRGECRCVDENGNQTEKEVEYDDRDSLSCFKDKCD